MYAVCMHVLHETTACGKNGISIRRVEHTWSCAARLRYGTEGPRVIMLSSIITVYIIYKYIRF